MLSAHRLSTVMPTEAFWMKGTSLHRVTPKGQSSARSCTGTPIIKGHDAAVPHRLRNFKGKQPLSVTSLCHDFHSHPCCFAMGNVSYYSFFSSCLFFPPRGTLTPEQYSSPWTSEHETFFMSALTEWLECKHRSTRIICGSATLPTLGFSVAPLCVSRPGVLTRTHTHTNKRKQIIAYQRCEGIRSGLESNKVKT